MTEFNNIKRLPNESVIEFNTRFQKRMYKLMQSMRVDDKVCLITYLNAFDGKTAYQLRDKEPRTLRDAFRMAINVENNLRISGRLESKRDDPRLFGNKGNRREDHKIAGGKKQESSEISQVLNAIKNLSLP